MRSFLGNGGEWFVAHIGHGFRLRDGLEIPGAAGKNNRSDNSDSEKTGSDFERKDVGREQLGTDLRDVRDRGRESAGDRP